MKKNLTRVLLGILILALFALPAQATVNKMRWASCLTGGGDCVDGIDGNIITAGDVTLATLDAGSTTPQIYFYLAYGSSATANSPLIISPTTNAGTLRWHLVNVFGRSFNGVGVDGESRIFLNNNTARTPAANANEFYPIANVWHGAENGVDMGAIAFATKAQTLTNKTLTGPKETIIAGGTCSTSYNVDPTAGTQITLTLNGACQIGVTNLAAGHSFTIKLTQSSTTAPTFTSAYKWALATPPTWSTSATKYDIIACVSPDGSTLNCAGIVDVR